MAELQPVHRYAAGALLALALHQAQIHQCSSPSHADTCFLGTHVSTEVAEYDEKDNSLWISPRSGLLRSIFRYLEIDSKAWAGLEQTALSTDAKFHVGAFLRILSEEEEESSTSSNAQVNLAEAVDTLALTFEGQSASIVSVSHDGNHPAQPSKGSEDFERAPLELPASENVSDSSAKLLDASSSSCISRRGKTERIDRSESFEHAVEERKTDSDERNNFTVSEAPFREKSQESSSLYDITVAASSGLSENLQGINIDCRTADGSGGVPMLREDYFAPCQSEGNSNVLEPSAFEKEPEIRINAEENVDGKRLREVPMDETVEKDSSDDFWKDSPISEGRLLTRQRKVAVLYELLSASVADVPLEKDQDESKLRRGYDARQRVALRLLAMWLDVKWTKLAAMEVMVAYSAMAAQEEREANKDDKDDNRKSWARWKRGGLIGAAALTGGALLALTGGLAAPAIAAGLSALAPTLGTIIPVIGSTGFAAAAAAAGSTVGSVAVAASFGAAGAGLSGSKMFRRTGGVEEFGFEGIGENHQQGRLAVGIVISGFVNDPEDFTKPWKGQDGDLERYALRWETKILTVVSTAIQDWLTASITKEVMKQGAMLTVLSTLVAALAWPSALLSLTDLIDSKWAIAVDRSDKVGKLLAKVLLQGLQGSRPVTLIGFSLGARVIFKCLEKLAKKGENGRIVERVVLLGAPISTESVRWEIVRKVVAGRFINAYSTNDWLLAVVYRASLLSQGLAGIQSVDVPGIENQVDVTDLINGHSSYLSNVGEILQALDIDCYYPVYPAKIIGSGTYDS